MAKREKSASGGDRGVKGMGTERKKVLMIAGIAALIVIAVIVLVLSFDINSYKPRIEAAASEATGLDVRIRGKVALAFFPFGVSAADIHVAGRGEEILTLDRLRMRVALIPLLKKELRVTSCRLVRPAITIVRDAEGRYNFEGARRRPGLKAVSRVQELTLSQGALVYRDQKTGEKTELKEITATIAGLSIEHERDIVKDVSFSGHLECGEVLYKDFRIDNIRSTIKAAKGVVYLKPLTMDIFGAKGEGDASAEQSESGAVYKINLRISQLDFERLEESFGAKELIGGKGDLAASLTLKETGSGTLMSGMDGTFSLRGDDLVIYTMDLDKVLSSYASSQKFNLVDLGAYYLAGPLSIVALKAYHYGDIYRRTRGGHGLITRFVSHWRITGGVAEAIDCALATSHNRVALKGKLDLVGERYDKVIVALLDDKGCAKFKQSISGPFGSPRVGAVSTLESLAGPIADLYRKAERLVRGGRCEVFYSGAVQQP